MALPLVHDRMLAQAAARPKAWPLDGFPQRSPSHGSIASRTSAWIGVVAL